MCTQTVCLFLLYRAARHGLQLSGKLKRIEQQESRLQNTMLLCSKDTEDSCTVAEAGDNSDHTKILKKRKHRIDSSSASIRKRRKL